MTKKSLLIVLLLSITHSALACKLPRGERLTIGCGYYCDFLYRLRLRLAGVATGYPVEFYNMRLFSGVTEAMDAVDAILLPGGADINPNLYLDDVTPELASYTRENLELVKFSKEGTYRDGFEYELVRSYSNDDHFEKMPMLGICRGMQMMSVAQGIPLYLDIKTEVGIKNRYHLFERVQVGEKDSLMSTIYRGKIPKGYKQHHQGVRMPYYREHAQEWPNVRITATSNKGRIAEAIEYTHRPALGVQYHPEKSFSRTSFPIYRWFLTKACEYKNSKDNL